MSTPWGGPEHRLRAPSLLGLRPQRRHGQKYRQVPGGERRLYLPEAGAEGPQLGPKAFEQCAGFLRVPESKNVLDHTAVHPESYAAAEQLLALCGYDLNAVEAGGIGDLRDRVTDFGEARAAQACGVGFPPCGT